MADDRPSLVISDTQWPFENRKAFEHCKYLKRHYRIPDENVFHVGDESDQLFASLHPRDPDAELTYSAEIRLTREIVASWASEFPKMKIANSNHMLRLLRKAFHADLPREVIKPYSEIIGAPAGWIWQDEWIVKTKYPWRMIHGMGYSGINGARTAALDAGISTCIGHLHSHAGIAVITTGMDNNLRSIWGMNTGCLIDVASYAFKYGKYSRFRPSLGCSVIFNRGSLPMWIPLL